ncbi:SDR family oxidoreductase [Paludifilum halophilum]|uniref:NAD-dependent dehydratase n=1 Tax=Paludifilum halophilum TaxID=1642702 RepID=A0A235BA57_9BACL|nr:SDR family oxidoreductase [Paludifilum halophilum]OYD08465.1 NAD-dependent dehydratase [Paludifilum halophilum]
MKVLVIGANGKTGRQLVGLLGESASHRVRAMVRDEEQVPALQDQGAEVVVADLEQDFSHAFDGIEAVIFAAGSGAHTGPEKTESVDYQGAVRSVEEAEKHGVDRYIMLSSIAADDPDRGPSAIRHYLRAKGKADERLQHSRLNYTVVRPGGLSNDPPQGKIEAAERITDLSRRISRADVAAVLAACLDIENTSRRTFEILAGETPIEEALQTV